MSYYENLRQHEKEAIADIVETMSYKLEKNRRKVHKEGIFSVEGEHGRDWRDISIYTLLELLEGEVRELREEISVLDDCNKVRNEAADVANFAMMIHNISSNKNENVYTAHTPEMINILSECVELEIDKDAI